MKAEPMRRMRAGRSIVFRLTLVVTACTSAILFATLGYNYFSSRAQIERELEENAQNLTLASVNRVETVLSSVTRATEALGRAIEDGRLGEAETMVLLRRSVESNPEIFGSAIAYEPAASGSAARLRAPYFFRDGKEISFARLEQSYDYLTQDWYRIPRELGRAEWSEPYFDEGGGNALMATLSVPFFETAGATRHFRGIVTSDIALDWLTQAVASIKVLDTGYAFLVSRNGTIVTHPAAELIMNETIFSLAEDRNDAALRETGRRMLNGESGFVPVTSFPGFSARMYYAPIPSVGWTLAIVFPENELFADVRRLNLTAAAGGLAGVLLIGLAVALIARAITAPLRRLTAATAMISGGNFDARLPEDRSGDEVGELGRAFATMNESLREHIRQLTLATASRERMDSELRIARDIQMAILPKSLPPSPDTKAFDFFALIEPAREVGGDFYDFFLIDDTHLCLVMADVSGKGIPASLFMAVTKTLIKATASTGHAPADILTRVNGEIARDNDQSMFVTVFFAVLDLQTGGMVFTNAGHNPPLLIRSNGTIAPIGGSGQLVLGAMEDTVYRDDSSALAPGDRLFLYTDGVTEAMSPGDEMYGNERLERALAQLRDGTLREMAHGVVDGIRAFAETTPQSDDITIMAFEYLGGLAE